MFPRYLLLLGLLLAPAMPAIALSGLPSPVLQQLNKQKIPSSAVSIYVQDVESGKLVLSLNTDVPRNPASVMKLVTTAAALELLGPAHTWDTEFYATEHTNHENLHGDLYIKGGGDPWLVSQTFWEDLRQLRLKGVKSINGDLVLDDSYLSPAPEDPGAFDGEPFRPYNATPNSLLFNFGATHFIFQPNVLRGRVDITVDPAPANLRIRNRIKLEAAKCNTKMSRIRMDVSHADGQSDVVFSGSFPRACGDAELYRVVTSPENSLYGAFKAYWQELGGSFTGKLRMGKIPDGATLLLRGKSLPLAEVVRKINKESNNVMARQLLMTIGAERNGEPGTKDKGADAVEQWLNKIGIGADGLILDNGAGLSRVSRISAEKLGKLLYYMYRGKNMPEYLASLSINGVDGTMKKRLRNGDIKGGARIKTGTVKNAKSVAGYLLTQSARRLVVVMLINHPRAGAGRYAQDALITWLHDNM